jgi:hypothetical protein
MKYATEKDSDAMIDIASFVKTGSGMQKLMSYRQTHSHTG